MGARLPFPYGLIAAFLSHPLADLIPHWDFNTRQCRRSRLQLALISLTDASAGLLVSWLIFRTRLPLPYLLAAVFAAQLLDWLEGPYALFGWRFPPFSWVKTFQRRCHWKLPFPWGLVSQLVVVAAFLWWAVL